MNNNVLKWTKAHFNNNVKNIDRFILLMILFYFHIFYPTLGVSQQFGEKGMCLMGKFNFIPNCVALLLVLSSGYQTLAIFEMFNVGASRGEYIPGSALIELSIPEKSFSGFPQIPKSFPSQVFFG